MYHIKESYLSHIREIFKHYLLMHIRMLPIPSDVCCPKVWDNTFIKKTLVKEHFPFIILIGGHGGAGKSTFIHFCSQYLTGVFEESTIDCCKDVVKFMADYEAKHNRVSTLRQDIQCKSDKYRTLLNVLKAAWCDIDDGPNRLVLNTIQNCIDTDDPSIIFVNVREPEQITHLKNLIEDTIDGVVMTLAVTRPDNTAEWTNEGDVTTMNYDYDIYINNATNLDQFQVVAEHFCDAVIDAFRQLKNLLYDASFFK